MIFRTMSRAALLGLCVLLSGCGGGKDYFPPPTITSFTAAKNTVTSGEETTLTAIFSNGSGVVDQRVGTVLSGAPRATGAVLADTTYSLTVTGHNGMTATQLLTIQAVPQAGQPKVTAPAYLTVGATGSASVSAQDGCTYAWSISGGSLLSGSDASTVNFTAGTSGYALLSCIVTNAMGVASPVGSAITTVVAAPTVPTLSAPPMVASNQMGCTASVPVQDGCSYAWTISGGIITSGDATNTVVFIAGATGTVQLSCVLTNKAGISASAGTLVIPVVALAGQPTVTAPTYLTVGATGSASVSAQDGCRYAWSISGGSLLSGSDASTVNFTAGTSGYALLSCIVTNALGVASPAGSAITTVVAAPTVPTLSAPSMVASNQMGCTASVPAQDGCRYAWTISGGVITAGDANNAVIFSAGASGVVQLSCVLTNKAGVSSPAGTLVIPVVALAGQPMVNAPTYLTVGATGSASVSAQDGCKYAWSISGGSLLSGSDASTVNFTAGTSGYALLSCIVSNAMGVASPAGSAITTILPLPVAPMVTAPSLISPNQAGYTASVPAQAGYSYAWTISGGAITAGDGTNAVTFTAGASGALQLSCVLTNLAGTASLPGITACSILNGPTTPDITLLSTALAAGGVGSAMVTSQSNCTYVWTLKGGTFTTSTTGNSVSFSVSAKSPLVLTCMAVNSLGVQSAVASKSVDVTFTDADVLASLNINTDLGPRKNAQGQDMTSTDQPLGNGTVNIRKIDEPLVVDTANNAYLLSSDLAHAFTQLPVSSLSTSAPTPDQIVIPVPANLYADGKQEVVLFSFPGPSRGSSNDHFTVSLLTGGSGSTLTMKGTVPWTPTSLNTTDGDPRQWYQKFSAVAGDLNKDGKQEIVLMAEDKVYIFDSALNLISGPTSLAPVESFPFVRVACADIDHDGRDEILLFNGGYTSATVGQLSIWQLNSDNSISKKVDGFNVTQIDTSHPTPGISLRGGAIAASDIDADGKVEIVLSGLVSGTSKNRTLMAQVGISGGVWTPSFLPVGVDGDLCSSRWLYRNYSSTEETNRKEHDAAVPVLALADLDGDGMEEIISADDVLTYTAATSLAGASLDYAYDSTSKQLLWGDVVNEVNINRRDPSSMYGQAAVSRLTSDPKGLPEILILNFRNQKLRRYYYDSETKRMLQGTEIQYSTTGQFAPFLCLADLNDDGTVVEYLGHALTFTKPMIKAVLASPPYWTGLTHDQNTGNSFTQFGNSSGISGGFSASMGFSVATMGGVKITLPVVSNGEVEIKVTQKYAWDFAFETTYGYTRDISYATYAGSDAVLFAAVPVDVYGYRVTRSGSNSKVKVGDTLFIQREREALLQFTDVDFYNAHCGKGPEIDRTILQHTLGRPFTYPTRAQAASLVVLDLNQGFLLANSQSGIVPEGNLYNTITYSTSLETGISASWTSETSIEAEVSLVVLAGGSQSFSVGATLSSQVSLGSSIVGCVGGLDAADYSGGTIFKWGIFSYNKTIPATADYNKQDFKVLNYWVQ